MPYAMRGPQVEPSASYWADISSLRALRFGRIKDLDIPRHPQSSSTLQRDISLLEFLALPVSRAKTGAARPGEAGGHGHTQAKRRGPDRPPAQLLPHRSAAPVPRARMPFS